MRLVSQPLSVTVTATDNTDCIGRNCFYNGPTILINEVMLAPSSYDGSMVGSAYHTTGGGEWIELYNPHKCDSADISCYFLGNNAYDNTYQTGNWPGGFVIPPGTVVPPQGFAMIRGARAEAVPAELLVQNGGNVVEVVIDSRYCFGTGGGRLWFPNAGGWFAFYDANGVPQDAISWCNQTNSCMSCPPCNPGLSDCGYMGDLPSYDAIPTSRKNYMSSYNPANYLGQSFRRIPDGGIWMTSPGSPTYATCNDTCLPPAELSCNAMAIAMASGGTPPYSYQWDDNSYQTTDTAFALCAGTYTVTVTDADFNTVTAQVTITNHQPDVFHPSTSHCLNDSSAVLSGIPEGGTYEGWTFSNNTLQFHDSIAVYYLTYTVTDTNGCTASTEFTVTVNPNYDTLIYDTICQFDSYQKYNFSLSGEDVAFAGDFVHYQNLHNEFNCDSIVQLNLTVTASPIPDFIANPERAMFSDQIETQFINITDLSPYDPNSSFSWHWDFGDGESVVTNGGDAAHRYGTWGQYVVTLTVVSDQGCENTVSHNVYIEADLVFPNIITPNGDKVNDVFAIGNLNPDIPNTLTIYDRWGKKVFERENYKTYTKDDILYNEETGFTGEHLSDGVYFYVFHYIGPTHAVDYHSTLTIIR